MEYRKLGEFYQGGCNRSAITVLAIPPEGFHNFTIVALTCFIAPK